MELRDYQSRTIAALFDWLYANPMKNPCVVLPTGAGKSVIIAAFCRKALTDFPGTRVLMCTHQKELIEQDFDKLRKVWPEADAGIYSAGIGRRELDNAITFCSIQSIWRHAAELGKVNLIIVDEAHLINANASGMYRSFIEDLRAVNPRLRVVGLTATPYRLSHGMITDKPAIFDEPLIEPVTIAELQDAGFLCQLTCKATAEKISAEGVGTCAGDYNQKQLQKAVDVPGKNEDVVRETLKRAADRKAILFFCSGVEHAQHIRDILRDNGVSAECVTGDTDKAERERILGDFKAGRIRALTNCDVLTTGFDAPNIDCIVMMRPTQSPGLYVQMAGRGLRICEGKANCLVLDFCGNVETHGTIHNVKPPARRKAGKGVAPCKICPDCSEIIAMQYRTCPVCGHVFESADKTTDKEYQLSEADINADRPVQHVLDVWRWRWSLTTSKAGNRMLCVRYYPRVFDFGADGVTQFFMLWHENRWCQAAAVKSLKEICEHCAPDLDIATVKAEEFVSIMNANKCIPSSVVYEKRGKYNAYIRSNYANESN